MTKVELRGCDIADPISYYLHKHAEAGLEQVGEASRHVLDVGAFVSVRVEDLLQYLPQERTVGSLEKPKTHMNMKMNTEDTYTDKTLYTEMYIHFTVN